MAKNKKYSTLKQRGAVRFCEETLYNITFEGNITDYYQVSSFLDDYLDAAKAVAEEAEIEERTWRWEKKLLK